jgi:hypothetical protein
MPARSQPMTKEEREEVLQGILDDLHTRTRRRTCWLCILVPAATLIAMVVVPIVMFLRNGRVLEW